MTLRYVGIGRPRRGARAGRQAPGHALQGEITMPNPQVNDRIKEAPAVMLRAVFAGVGQLLLAADKVRARATATGWPPDIAAIKAQALSQLRWHSLDDTRSDAVPLARDGANSHDQAAERPVPGHPGSVTDSPTATVTEARWPASPPLPGYDDLTLPSLRARLRGFDAGTLRALLAYEKAHARRDDVITLFERRLAKITAE
jgi:hypothetical protein